MMRRRTAVGLLAGVLLAGLIAVPGAPAGAQDIADLPRLGYEIAPDRGHVGDEVHSQVNPSDVSEHCWAGPSVVIGELDLSLNSFEVDFLMNWSPGSTLQLVEAFGHGFFGVPPQPFYLELLPLVIDKYGFFPPEDNPGLEFNEAVRFGPVPEGIPDDQDGQNFVNRVGAALNTVTTLLGIGEFLSAVYPALHITTFVDPVTQELLGEMGNFDPATGEGTMPVPELDPGLYAVAAACAFLVPEDQLLEALTAGFVAAWDWSVENDSFPTGTGPGGWQDWAEAGGLAAVVGEIVEPRAIGLDFYCILQDDGFCATPPGPVGLIDDDVLEEFNGEDPLAPGPGADGLEDHDDTGDLVAVQATPSFTG